MCDRAITAIGLESKYHTIIDYLFADRLISFTAHHTIDKVVKAENQVVVSRGRWLLTDSLS